MQKKGFSLLSGFELDLRSLGLFRAVFGLCLFIDIFYRLFYVKTFYSDYGLLPRSVVIEKFFNAWEWSFFFFNGEPLMVGALMVVLLIAIASFTLGFYTRISAFVCWLLLISLHSRNQIILHGGDDVFRTLLFWCQFAPLGAEFSIDKMLNAPEKRKDYRVLSFGATGLMLQFMFMYIFTALLKWDKVWWTEGSAVYYALSLDQFTGYFGKLLREVPIFMQLMTYATVVLELIGPFSVIAPIAFLRRRTFFAAAFILFHFGLAVNLVLGMFPWTCMAAWLMVLPPEFWQKVPEPNLSWLKKWAAWFKKQGWQGQSPKVYLGRGSEWVAAVFLFLVLTWNITQLDVLNLERSPGFRKVMHVAELYQRWSMFAPYPRKDDGWYVVEAELNNGDKWNTFSDQPVSFEKPDDVSGTYVNSMWRKYLTNIWLKSNNKYRLYFGRYLCRVWNERHEDNERQINTLQVFYMLEMTPPPGQPVPEPRKEIIWRHYCGAKPADWVE